MRMHYYTFYYYTPIAKTTTQNNCVFMILLPIVRFYDILMLYKYYTRGTYKNNDQYNYFKIFFLYSNIKNNNTSW